MASFGQPEGFLGVELHGGGGQTGVVAYDASGQLIHRPYTWMGTALTVVAPTGGMVFFSEFTGQLTAYDSRAAERWSRTLPAISGGVVALGVDLQRNLLLLYDGASSFGEGTVAGLWVDSSGQVGTPFLALTGLSNPRRLAFTFSPQVGSGLFLQVKDSTTPGKPAQWARAFPSMALASEPAPEWLSKHPDTSLQVVRGGRAYARLPFRGQASPDCSQSIEVLTPSGTSCGSTRFALGDSACTTGAITVGYDGTVVQQWPQQLEHCNDAGSCSCTWRWWPGLLK
jgi:hypothetical protein